MKKIIIIVGLPGSGKTTLIENMKELGDLLLDDISRRKTPFEDLVAAIHDPNAKRIIVSDPLFCHRGNQIDIHDQLKTYPVHLDWIFFENDPQQCLINVQHRNDGRDVNGFIYEVSGVYFIPENSHVIPVFTADKPTS